MGWRGRKRLGAKEWEICIIIGRTLPVYRVWVVDLLAVIRVINACTNESYTAALRIILLQVLLQSMVAETYHICNTAEDNIMTCTVNLLQSDKLLAASNKKTVEDAYKGKSRAFGLFLTTKLEAGQKCVTKRIRRGRTTHCLQRFRDSCILYLHTVHSNRSTTFFVVLA
jgi:hypothetical protein